MDHAHTFQAHRNLLPDHMRYRALPEFTPEGVADGVRRVIDAADASHAEAYYNLWFHNRYEDWVRTSTVTHPKPITESEAGWQVIKGFSNGNSTPLLCRLGVKEAVSGSMTGTVGTEVGVAGPDEILAFKVNESIEIGKTITLETDENYEFTVQPYDSVMVYAAIPWEDRTGTCSVWAANGYQSEASWHGTFVYGSLWHAVKKWVVE